VETGELSAVELRARMAQRGIRQGDLAIAAGLCQPDVSAILRGCESVGAVKREKFIQGILRLRLDMEHCSEPVKPAVPVFRIRRL